MTQTSAGTRPQNFSVPQKFSKPSPHYRMTPEMAKWEFQQGMSTVKGYLYHLIKTSRRDGHRFRVKDVKAFCKEHGISVSAYYKAISQLKAEGLISVEANGSMDLWVPENIISFSHKKSVHDFTHLSPNVESDSTIVESDSTIVEQKSPKVSEGKGSSTPSDPLQISYRSFKREREKKSKFSRSRS